jgi:hypothetical protein
MRIAVLVIGATLLGGLISSLAVAALPSSFEADAYTALAPMPKEVRAALGADQANAVKAVYDAGPLQEAALAAAANQLSTLTAAQIRASVQASAVPFTPLTKIASRMERAQDSIEIANAVATAWIAHLNNAYDAAFTTVATTLTTRDTALTQEIATTLQTITAGTKNCGPPISRTRPPCASPTQLAALQAKLNADLSEQTSIHNKQIMLDVRRAQVIRIAYVAVPADADTTSAQPDAPKLIELGSLFGFVAGAVVGLWLARRPVRQALTRQAIDSRRALQAEGRVRT